MAHADAMEPAVSPPRVWLLPTGSGAGIERPCIATESKPGEFIVQLPLQQLPDDAVLLAHDIVKSLVASKICLLPGAYTPSSTHADKEPATGQ